MGDKFGLTFRPGGPREKRLKKNGLLVPQVADFYSIRVSRLPKGIALKEFVSIFSKFGEIFSAKIPENLDTHEQKGFGFIAYKEETSQQRAIMEMDGTVLGNHIIGVQAASQESFFTKDTGYITNATLDNPEALVDEFDSSMPDAHYEAKYKSRPIDLSKLLTVKVDNLGPNISAEQVQTIFEAYGEIVKCHRPKNLCTKEYHPFAFVRFLRDKNAIAAAKEMNGKWVDGQELFVSIVKQQTYYSQDESTEVVKDVKN